MRHILRNVLFYCILAAWTAAVPFTLPYFLIRGRLRGENARIAVRRVNHLYGAGWKYCIAPWARVRYSGPPGGHFPVPCVIVANHQSFFDIHCLARTPNSNIVFTVRAWPFRLPFYGLFMRVARFINVEELSSEAVLEHVRADAAGGASIVFFPEGHRNPSPDRDRTIGRFHAGAFAAAVEAGLPVVPVRIRGSGGVLPPGTPWIRTGSIDIRVLDPVYPASFRHHGDGAARALRKAVLTDMRNAMQAP